MNPEKPDQVGSSAENDHPRLIELPMPRDGVLGEIFDDILVDRKSFLLRSLGELGQDNPYLYTNLIDFCMISPERDLSLDWALIYYQLYSRSVPADSLMMRVSLETVNAAVNAQNIKFGLPGQKDQETIAEIFVQDIAKSNLIADHEVSSNPEFERFWKLFTLTSDRLAISGEDPELRFAGLYSIQELLHAQADSNRLSQQFPST